MPPEVPDQSLPLTPDPSPLEEERRLNEVFGEERRDGSPASNDFSWVLVHMALGFAV